MNRRGYLSRILRPFPVLVLIITSGDHAWDQDGPASVSPGVVAAAADRGPQIPQGPFAPTRESLQANYQVPQWFRDAKFGIFLHWGLYAVPAKQSEWYVKHMYGNREIAAWHAEHFGPQDKFGYKDFIPLFTCEKFNPDEWATLFKKAGAKHVVPVAEHHDGFALWDSALTKWDAKDMGPKLDLIGDLAKAVRKQGLKFGVSNHRIEHYTFIHPLADLKTDLGDPEWLDFYCVSNRSDAACERFLADWVARNCELIDKYQPDMLWFDNGVNRRVFDPLKLKVAAYYYNRAAQWHRAVLLSTKSDAYLYGSIRDFERQSRAPKELTDYVWQCDDTVHQRWGYLADARYRNVGSVISQLVDNVSRNGSLLLNFSPKADGTIPEEQQKLLLGIGAWLKVNKNAIYGTRPWIKDGEESNGVTYRFTTRNNTLYAIAKKWPGELAIIRSLASSESLPQPTTSLHPSAEDKGASLLIKRKVVSGQSVQRVELLGHKGKLEFTQDAEGFQVTLPKDQPGKHAWVLKITGFRP